MNPFILFFKLIYQSQRPSFDTSEFFLIMPLYFKYRPSAILRFTWVLINLPHIKEHRRWHSPNLFKPQRDSRSQLRSAWNTLQPLLMSLSWLWWTSSQRATEPTQGGSAHRGKYVYRHTQTHTMAVYSLCFTTVCLQVRCSKCNKKMERRFLMDHEVSPEKRSGCHILDSFVFAWRRKTALVALWEM